MSDVSRGLTPAQKTAIENAAAFNNKRDVTATRAKDVTYLNDTGKALFVMVGFSDVAGEAQALSDGATPPTEILGVCGSETVPQSFPFMVAAGDYYKMKTLSGSITINRWVEWY